MRVISKYMESTTDAGVSSYQFVVAFSPALPNGVETYAISIVDIGQTETEVLADMQARAVVVGNNELVNAGLPGDLNITNVRGGTL